MALCLLQAITSVQRILWLVYLFFFFFFFDYFLTHITQCAVWRKEQWIVCQVIKAQKERGGTIRYEMEDVDPEPDPVGLEKRFYVAPRHVIPLPTSIPDANRQKPPEAEYEAGSIVLALYPTTTCLYQGTVLQPPSKVLQYDNPRQKKQTFSF